MTPEAVAPNLIIWTVGEAGLAAELQEGLTEVIATSRARLEFQVRHLTKEEDPPSGDVHIVIASVATRTWSRARHVTPKGPPPLRSADWPWGFPWLSSSHRAVVEEANSQLTYVLHALAITCSSHTRLALSFCIPKIWGQPSSVDQPRHGNFQRCGNSPGDMGCSAWRRTNASSDLHCGQARWAS